MWRTDELRNMLLRGESRVLVRVLHKLIRDLDQLRKHDHSRRFNRQLSSKKRRRRLVVTW